MKFIVLISILFVVATAKSISKPTQKYPKKYDPQIHDKKTIEKASDAESSYIDYVPVQSGADLNPLRVGLLMPYQDPLTYTHYEPVFVDSLRPPPISSSYTVYVEPKKPDLALPGETQPLSPPKNSEIKRDQASDASSYTAYSDGIPRGMVVPSS